MPFVGKSLTSVGLSCFVWVFSRNQWVVSYRRSRSSTIDDLKLYCHVFCWTMYENGYTVVFSLNLLSEISDVRYTVVHVQHKSKDFVVQFKFPFENWWECRWARLGQMRWGGLGRRSDYCQGGRRGNILRLWNDHDFTNCSKIPCGWVGGTGKNWSPNPPSWHICRVPYGGLGTPVKTIPQPTLVAHPKSLNCCNSKAEIGVGSLAEQASSGCSILLPSFRSLEI